MYLTDGPIQKMEDDLLNRNVFVNELANSLLLRDITESLVIGLDGPWGSGKSSILNLLEARIKEDGSTNTTIIRFDPWYFNSAEKLLESFLHEIYCIVDGKNSKKEIKTIFTKYRKMLTSVELSPKVSLFGVVEFSIGKFGVDLENPEKIRSEIRGLIGKAEKRAIILIDNLDRLDITELMLMFKLVRLCSDFPGVTFILALDKKQILNLLERSNIASEFVEKIIQVDIELPAIQQGNIAKFTLNALEAVANSRKVTLDNDFKRRIFQVYYDTVDPTLITTIREAKRFINAVDFSLPLVKGEVDYADFFVLQVIRVFFSDVYDLLPQYKAELTRFDYLSFGDNSRKEEKIAVFKELKEKIQSMSGDRQKIARDLVSFLFPNFRAYLQNPANPIINTYSEDYEKNQLITSGTHFDRYFTLRIPSNETPTSWIHDFIDRLNTTENELFFEEQFVQKFRENNSDNLVLALKKLNLYVDRINPGARIHIVRSITNHSLDIVYDPESMFIETEFSMFKKLTANCIALFGEDQRSLLILDVIQSTPSLFFCLNIAQELSLGKTHTIDESSSRTILESFRKRLHRDLISKEIDIFASYPTGFISILDSWKNKNFLDEKEEAEKYTAGLLERNPMYVAKILSTCIWVDSGTRKPAKFDHEKFIQSYDPQTIKMFVDRLDTTNLSLSEAESFALAEFKRIFSTPSSNKLND